MGRNYAPPYLLFIQVWGMKVKVQRDSVPVSELGWFAQLGDLLAN